MQIHVFACLNKSRFVKQNCYFIQDILFGRNLKINYSRTFELHIEQEYRKFDIIEWNRFELN